MGRYQEQSLGNIRENGLRAFVFLFFPLVVVELCSELGNCDAWALQYLPCSK